jgi:hypothetical protein
MNFSLVKKTIGITAAMLITGQASAALITNWNWTLDSAWTATTPALGSGVTGSGLVDVNGTDGYSTISWGTDIGNGQSSLVVQNPELDSTNASAVAFELTEVAPGVYGDIQFATLFTHNNFVIELPGITEMTLTDYFTLTGLGLAAPSLITNPDFDWAFKETTNTDSGDDCFAADPFVTPCSDILVLKNPAPLQISFQEDGYNYSILVGATNLVPLDASACTEAGEGFPCVGLITEEAASTNVQFFITLTATKIAEPSALALMGLGLLGFGFSRRQKRK